KNIAQFTRKQIYKVPLSGKAVTFPKIKGSSTIDAELMTIDSSDNIYIFDLKQNSIFRVNSDGNNIHKIADFKTFFDKTFNFNSNNIYESMAVDNKNKLLYIGAGSKIFKLDIKGE